MNRNAAKIVTKTGIFCCAMSAILLIFNVGGTASRPLISALFFVIGIALIFVSLAYYTDR